MKKLVINFSEVESVSKKINNHNQEFIKLLNEIKTAHSNLKNSWQGEDANKYLIKAEIQSKQMDDLSETINYLVDFLSFVSESLEKTMQENTNMIKQR